MLPVNAGYILRQKSSTPVLVFCMRIFFLLLTGDALQAFYINEVNYDDKNDLFELHGNPANEFVEIYDGGVGNSSMTWVSSTQEYKLALVRLNAMGRVTATIDLSPYSTDQNGFFVIGGVHIHNRDLNMPGLTCNRGGAWALYAPTSSAHSSYITNFVLNTGKYAFLHDVLVWEHPDTSAVWRDTLLYTSANPSMDLPPSVHSPNITDWPTEFDNVGNVDKSLSRCSIFDEGMDRKNLSSFRPMPLTPGAPNHYCDGIDPLPNSTSVAPETTETTESTSATTASTTTTTMTTITTTAQETTTQQMTTREITVGDTTLRCLTTGVTTIERRTTSENLATTTIKDSTTVVASTTVTTTETPSMGTISNDNVPVCTCPTEPQASSISSTAQASSVEDGEMGSPSIGAATVGMGTSTMEANTVPDTTYGASTGLYLELTTDGEVVCPTSETLAAWPLTSTPKVETTAGVNITNVTAIPHTSTDSETAKTTMDSILSTLDTDGNSGSSTTAADCRPPPEVTNGFISEWTDNSTAVHSSVVYNCSTGYSLSGHDGRVVCNPNMTWSTPPVCRKYCDIPLVKNGTVNVEGLPVHDSVMDIECEQGFYLLQDSHVVCDAGDWKPGLPTCQPYVKSSEIVANDSESGELTVVWGVWLPWTSCTTTCGEGSRIRYRICNPEDYNCTANPIEVGYCYEAYCPKDGAWLSWGSWALCSSSCGIGTRLRSRKCLGPFHKGRPCEGKDKDRESCELEPCPDAGKKKIIKVVFSEGFTKSDERQSAKTVAAIAISLLAAECLGMLLLDINPYTVYMFFKKRFGKVPDVSAKKAKKKKYKP